MADEALLMRIAEALEGLDRKSQSAAQATFRTIWELEAEVNNGGLRHYFFSSAGRDALAAPAALLDIGAKKCAGLIEKALAVADLSERSLADDLVRQKLIANLDAAADDMLSDLDDEFYTYPNDLSELLSKFVLYHAGDFRPFS